MKGINFAKMVASGNDFIILDHLPPTHYPLGHLARQMCQPKFGIGADGLLVLEKSKVAHTKMRIFNADGSEAEMCGNGARCIALWAKFKILPQSGIPQCGKNSKSKIIKIETKAGIIQGEVNGNNVKIKLSEPKDIRLDIPLKINSRSLRVNFINTGVPHAVIFVEGLDKIDVASLGRQIRYHKKFAPGGTNVDFVEVLSSDRIRVRTYERGLEAETLACGTGAVAAALITDYQLPITNYRKINVQTKGQEVLKVYFFRDGDSFKDVWLKGKARVVCKGEYYV